MNDMQTKMMSATENKKAAAIAAMTEAMHAIKAARRATGRIGVTTESEWAGFERASAACLNEMAHLANLINPLPPVYGPFLASPEEFELLTGR